jgi:hypothetical protein
MLLQIFTEYVGTTKQIHANPVTAALFPVGKIDVFSLLQAGASTKTIRKIIRIIAAKRSVFPG